MTNFFDRIKILIDELDTRGIKDLRIVGKKYAKYKKDGKWKKAEITNFDRYREPSYNIAKLILKALFEKVEVVQSELPIICMQDETLYYLPNFIGKKKFALKDEILIAEKLKPAFSRLYQKIGSNSSLSAFYLGLSLMVFYFDKEELKEDAERLLDDIRNLYNHIHKNKLKNEEALKFFKSYYKDLFQETVPSPKIETEILIQPKLELTPKVLVQITEEKDFKVYPENERKKEEFSIEEIKEKISKAPYEEVKKVVEEYRPPTSNFFGCMVRIEYEKKISEIKNEEKKKDVDYLLYGFISFFDKAKNKQEFSRMFCAEIKNVN